MGRVAYVYTMPGSGDSRSSTGTLAGWGLLAVIAAAAGAVAWRRLRRPGCRNHRGSHPELVEAENVTVARSPRRRHPTTTGRFAPSTGRPHWAGPVTNNPPTGWSGSTAR